MFNELLKSFYMYFLNLVNLSIWLASLISSEADPPNNLKEGGVDRPSGILSIVNKKNFYFCDFQIGQDEEFRHPE